MKRKLISNEKHQEIILKEIVSQKKKKNLHSGFSVAPALIHKVFCSVGLTLLVLKKMSQHPTLSFMTSTLIEILYTLWVHHAYEQRREDRLAVTTEFRQLLLSMGRKYAKKQLGGLRNKGTSEDSLVL